MQEAKWHEWNSFEGQTKPVSHGDLIRRWSDEEIAIFTVGVANGIWKMIYGEDMPLDVKEDVQQQWLEWLQKEADNA